VALRFHNTLTGTKDVFEPLEPGHVGMYTCGPTVWNYAHVGNLRAFLFYDLLRRHLRVSGFAITHVMNLTDIDDRILDQATHAGVTISQYVEPYVDAFFDDMRMLRAEPAEHFPRATEHIPEMAEMISTLLERGHAYIAEGDVYYRIDSFPHYGELSRLDRTGLRAGARVAQGGRRGKGSARPARGGESPRIRQDKYEKESVSDFALWKRAQPNDEQIGAAWDAPFGRGRPGWHIECSAMSKRYLGPTLDIHGGGVDLMFPHHENEIAQSEAANGQPFARVWLHSEHLAEAGGEKMSKSAGGFTTLRDLTSAGHDPVAVRFFLIAGAHYRSKLRLTDEALHSAAEQVRRLRDLFQRLNSTRAGDAGGQELIEHAAQTRALYREALDDDLNLPRGLGHVFDFVRETNVELDAERVNAEAMAAVLNLLRDVDEHLDVLQHESTGDGAIEGLIAEREKARAARDFARADRIRDELREKGIALEDSREGVRWRRVTPG